MVDPLSRQSICPVPVTGRLRLTGVIRKSGFVDDPRIVGSVHDVVDDRVRDSLRRWTFQPALRSGIAVDIDIVLEIPIRLAAHPQAVQD
jgi:hypothetical protein